MRVLANIMTGGLMLLSLYSHIAQAHNKVVVVPMAGDEVPADLTPTTPIANLDTDQTDYIIGAFTVVDKITKLEWQRSHDTTARTWDESYDYCAGINLDGHTDWRIPDIKELQSILDYGAQLAPFVDQVAFPNTSSDVFWSSTNNAASASNAWTFRFTSRGTNDIRTKAGAHYARCVR